MAKVTHVVVDSRDGYTFNRGGDGELFTEESAEAFADHRNYDAPKRFENDRPYGVFRLVQASQPDGIMVIGMPDDVPPEAIMAMLSAVLGDSDSIEITDDMLAAAGMAMR